MAILEIGIIKGGVPLIAKQYYKEHKINVNPVLRGGFLSGLNTFIEQTFSSDIESFIMKNFKMVFLTHQLNDSNRTKLIIYCIGDKNLEIQMARKALTKVVDAFTNKYGNLENFKGDLTIFKEFQRVIDDILGDLIRKPDDRVRSVF
ncbi:MAG: hypothetical protein HWN65_21920 [Candidatus Helarchaeota archaeon]|nr:hypothetical protein [Candidatus Helarchaeota archaeon]